MKFSELSNEEIIYINALLGDTLSSIEDVIEKKGISVTIDSPFGPVSLFKEFTDEEYETIIKSERRRIIKSIVEKLRPVSELILEAEPELSTKISSILFPEDESEAEDL